MGLKESDYTVAFQSRLDKKWLRPFSDEVIEQWAK
jgi:protoheme ferro-lyase